MLALLVGTLLAWVADARSLTVAWLPSWDAELSFELDGLALLYALIASGIGLAVALYSVRYLPAHLEETDAPQSRQPLFYGLLVLFAVSMVGLAAADDLLLVFVFWDLTAVASYFLIGFDREKRAARTGALAAMLVTGVTGVFLLIGAVVLWAHHGTFSLAALLATGEPDTLTTSALGLIIAAALAKSAQAPFHLWLPRAMVAPTPVSAYLHSAAMVAAGVLLIGRVYPLVEQSGLLLDLLLGLGFASIVTGGVLALAAGELKRILAYSTISQYGYVVAIYGLGGSYAAGAAALYVVGHAIEKSTLFLTSGAIGQATRTEKLSELGGLARRMPALAFGSGLAAAGIVALPLTLGFFQDELFFKTALDRGWAAAAAAAAAATLTLVYIGRFWVGIFLGSGSPRVDAIPRSLTVPVVVLGLAVGVGGVWPLPFAELAEEAATASASAAAAVEVAYHLDLRAENVLALSAYVVGGALLAARAAWQPFVARVAKLGEAVGPTRIYDGALKALNLLSDRLHGLEVRDLRTRVATVLLPAGLLAAAGLLVSAESAPYDVGSFGGGDLELALALAPVMVAALALTLVRLHLGLVLLLAGVGYGLAVVYAFFGAPDVALVAALVETILALLFFAVLALLRPDVLRREERLESGRSTSGRDAVLATIAGLFAGLVAWGALSGRHSGDAVGPQYTELAEDAHAKDAVTAILADFRGLDTLGELTVLGIGVLGVVGMLRRGALW